VKRFVSGILFNLVRFLKNQFLNFETYYRIRSLQTSYEFVQATFPAPPVRSREDLLALLPEPREADVILEFGVWQGESINQLARRYPKQAIHGFDSFEGLPQAWGVLADKAHFDVQGQLPKVPGNVSLHKGWFKDTLPGFIATGLNSRIFLLHIDCDIYSSTKDVFDCLGDRLDGSYVLFDEYFGYPGWEHREHRAFVELVHARGFKPEYLGCTVKGKVLARVSH